jgi:hypothetical protein
VRKAEARPGGPELAARFAKAYLGSYPPEDAFSWAEGAVPPPQVALERRRWELYRGVPDEEAVRAYEQEAAAWDAELGLIRDAYSHVTTASPAMALPQLSDERDDADEPQVDAPPPPSRRLVVIALAGVTAAALAVGIAGFGAAGRHSITPSPSPLGASLGTLLVQRAGSSGGADGLELDGGHRFVTIAVTCQGGGSVIVLLSDGTSAQFGCTPTFPRTAEATSSTRLDRFSFSLRTTGAPTWALALFG